MASVHYQIKNLQNFFTSKIVSYKINKLTAAGDNYGGALVAIDVVLEDKNLALVAKVLPKNEYIQKMFNSQQTFRNEVGFYQNINPYLKKNGLNELPIPDFYGTRFSLNSSSTKIDEDAVLLLQNIKNDGFDNIDKKIGFNLEQSKIILEKIAQWHGSTYALSHLKPDIFQKEFGTYLAPYKIFENEDKDRTDFVDSILQLLLGDENCIKNMKKIEETMYINSEKICFKNHPDFISSTKFNGIVHSDLWTNNIMIKMELVKFVDFQLYEYSSVTRDVIFFLYTSVNLETLKEHGDDLLKYYYEKFIQVLTTSKCDISNLSFDDFLNEMALMAKNAEFFHIMLMLRTIYANQEDAKEVEEIKQEDFMSYGTSSVARCEEKACFVVNEFIRKNWL